MITTNEFAKGVCIMYEGEPYIIVNFQHVKPGKGVAFVRTKIKGLRNQSVIEKNIRSGEKFEEPDIESKKMQYMYNDGTNYNFMDINTCEQVEFSKEDLGDTIFKIKEELLVRVMFYEGRPINIEGPNFIEVIITYCEPALKGDTVTGSTKPAQIETGATIKVPLFINEGEKIKIDTRTMEYIERVK